jgi:hypothetical protein
MRLPRYGPGDFARLLRQLADDQLQRLEADLRESPAGGVQRQRHRAVLQELLWRQGVRRRQLERCFWLSTPWGKLLTRLGRLLKRLDFRLSSGRAAPSVNVRWCWPRLRQRR